MKRMNTEDFVVKSKKIFGDLFNYSKVNYVNSTTIVVLICKIHGDFFVNPAQHLSYKRGCLYCKGVRLHIYDFVQKANKIHKNKYMYDKVKISDTKVIITCKMHGDFLQSISKHIDAKQGCPKCDISCKKDIKFVIDKGKLIHNDFYNYSKSVFIGMFNNIEIVCPIHGSFWQTPANHLNHKNKCPKCSYKNSFFTQEEWIEKANKKHRYIFDYSKINYKHNKEKVEIICRKHGSFLQQAAGHLRGNGCPYCVSHISKIQEEWLDSIFIPMSQRNVTVKIGNEFFRVDAYDENNNIIYEFYGDYWHGNPQKYSSEHINKHNKEKFGELYRKTIIREKRLLELGFIVISIWEKDFLSTRPKIQYKRKSER